MTVLADISDGDALVVGLTFYAIVGAAISLLACGVLKLTRGSVPKAVQVVTAGLVGGAVLCALYALLPGGALS